MSAPASATIAAEFGIHNTVVTEMMTTAFVLAYGKQTCLRFKILLTNSLSAFGPLFLGPLSEMFGRSRVFQLANMWFLGQ